MHFCIIQNVISCLITADDASSVSSKKSNKSASDKPKLFDFYQDNKKSLLELKELLDALDSTQRYSVDDANKLADEYGRECFNVSITY